MEPDAEYLLPNSAGPLKVLSTHCDLWGLLRLQPHHTPQLGHTLILLTACGRSGMLVSPKVVEHRMPALVQTCGILLQGSMKMRKGRFSEAKVCVQAHGWGAKWRNILESKELFLPDRDGRRSGNESILGFTHPSACGNSSSDPAIHLPHSGQAPLRVKGRWFLPSFLSFVGRVYVHSITRTNVSGVWEGCHAPTPRGRQEVTASTRSPVDIMGPTPGKDRIARS